MRPEQSGNIGAAARAIKNMGLLGRLIIVGDRSIIGPETVKFARHAYDRIETADFVPTLEEAKTLVPKTSRLLASTARVGSSTRPHPVTVGVAVPREIERLRNEASGEIAFVFGPESDGLSNQEIELCDAVVTIPTSPDYRSINLSQAVLIFCYEANQVLNQSLPEQAEELPGQRTRLIQNLISLAEEAGFILPGDPHKMRARLEEILSKMPKHIPDARTLHGLLDQVRRSLRKGQPDFRGRFLREIQDVKS